MGVVQMCRGTYMEIWGQFIGLSSGIGPRLSGLVASALTHWAIFWLETTSFIETFLASEDHSRASRAGKPFRARTQMRVCQLTQIFTLLLIIHIATVKSLYFRTPNKLWRWILGHFGHRDLTLPHSPCCSELNHPPPTCASRSAFIWQCMWMGQLKFDSSLVPCWGTLRATSQSCREFEVIFPVQGFQDLVAFVLGGGSQKYLSLYGFLRKEFHALQQKSLLRQEQVREWLLRFLLENFKN